MSFYTCKWFCPVLNLPRCNCAKRDTGITCKNGICSVLNLQLTARAKGTKIPYLKNTVPFITGGSSGPNESSTLYSPESLISSVSMATGAPGNKLTSSTTCKHENENIHFLHTSLFSLCMNPWSYMMHWENEKNDFLPFCGSWNKWEKMEVVGFAEVLSFDPDLSDSLLFLFFSKSDLPLCWCPLSGYEDWSLVSVISVVGLSEDLLLLDWLSVAGGLFEMLLVSFAVSSSESSESVLPKMASKRSMEGRASSCKLFSANWK